MPHGFQWRTASRHRSGQRLGQPVQPRNPVLVEHFEKDGFATVEVAKHVRLRQSDALTELTQADVGDGPGPEHRAGRIENRAPTRFDLLRPARALKSVGRHHHARLSDHRSIVCCTAGQLSEGACCATTPLDASSRRSESVSTDARSTRCVRVAKARTSSDSPPPAYASRLGCLVLFRHALDQPGSECGSHDAQQRNSAIINAPASHAPGRGNGRHVSVTDGRDRLHRPPQCRSVRRDWQRPARDARHRAWPAPRHRSARPWHQWRK